MRWTRELRLTSVTRADGEVVWSWRPDAGAKLCGDDLRRRWQTSPVTGESTKETVKTIAQGMPGDPGVTVVTNSRVFYTTREAAGASSARHSLRPLIGEGGTFPAKLGRNAPRDREAVSTKNAAEKCRCLKIESEASGLRRFRGHRPRDARGRASRSVCPLPPCGGELGR